MKIQISIHFVCFFEGCIFEKITASMHDEINPEPKSFYTQLKDGSIVTNPHGKSHSVQRQVQNPDGSWRIIFEIIKDIPMTFPALDKGERYLIAYNDIFEIVYF